MTVWKAGGVSYVLPTEEIRINLENSGSVLSPGVGQANYMASYDGRITAWEIVGIPAGSIVVHVLKRNLAVPDSTNDITGSDPPTLTNENLNSNNQISGWTDVYVTKGDVFGVEIISASTVTNVVVTLKVEKW